jgi:carbon-monoxide dehydrogenase medium subunit
VAALLGQTPTEEAIRGAAADAAERDVDPPGDIHATAAYRRHLVEILTRRALVRAVEKAKSSNTTSTE